MDDQIIGTIKERDGGGFHSAMLCELGSWTIVASKALIIINDNLIADVFQRGLLGAFSDETKTEVMS